MKKLPVFLIVSLVFFGSCSAQNANAQSSNDAQRIVGTWRYVNPSGGSDDGWIWVFTFNSNGTFTFSGTKPNESQTFQNNGTYFVSGSNLILKRNNTSAETFNIVPYYVSSNRLVITNLSSSVYGYSSFWLEKQ
jgi:hypothetical protein